MRPDSNGGGFTYLLWSARPKVFAAFAPSAAGSRGMRSGSLEPRPVMHIAGKKDQTVPFETQVQTMKAVRKQNQCSESATTWDKDCLKYSSSRNAVFISFIHDGDHKYPDAAPALIAKFFKELGPTKAGSVDP